MYLIYLPIPNKPNPTWNNPAIKNTVKITGNAFETSPSKEATIPAIITIATAIIGAVGPDIWVSVPPNNAAKKPTNMAPYNPALGPRPELTPNANAKGNATIPAVIPPKRSPLKCLKLNKFLKAYFPLKKIENSLYLRII